MGGNRAFPIRYTGDNPVGTKKTGLGHGAN
jgi:hypothetical protein